MHDGIDVAAAAVSSGDFDSCEVWVAAGTYTRTPPGKDAVVMMKEGVAIFGGFEGTEPGISYRDLSANITRIDGQNSYRCVSGADNARIDGFTIQNGYRDVGKDGDKYDFDDYDGAGMYNRDASPTVANCIFLNNEASANGGGMGNRFGSPTVINCAFIGNSTGGGVNGGGGIHNYAASPVIINCTFYGNVAGAAYGGMQNEADRAGTVPVEPSSDPVVKNSIFWGNTGAGGVQIGDYENLDGTATVSNSCVQGGYSGTGNIAIDPMFVDATSGDLRLVTGSPCIDTDRKSVV